MMLRMLRVALPGGGDPDDHTTDGQALALLQAVGGFQAFRRAVPQPPNARPVGRFLLYERAYPDSVAASVESLHEALTEADANYRKSAPVLRLGRLQADLDFRSRALEANGGGIMPIVEDVRQELAQVDADIAVRYFGGASPPAARMATP